MEEAEAAAGPAPAQSAAEELDLSLDDIIKRNRKGQTNAKTRGNRRWRPPLKNRNPPYSNNGRPRFWTWAPRNLQGPNRFRVGFRKQPQYRKPFWNGGTGPRRRAVVGPNGVSPLNRPALAQQSSQVETMLVESGDGAGADGAAASVQGPPGRVKPFKMAGASLRTQRPFRLNRRPAFLQRQSRFNFRRGRTESNAEGKPSRMRRWQLQPNSGAVLTVSVANPQASQTNMPGAKRPFLRGRGGTPSKIPRRQPKGVPLRFNFRAVANQVENSPQLKRKLKQTSLTLNERFSGLRNKWRFSALRNTDRMVTLP